MHRSIMISFAFLDQLFYLLICLLICLLSCPSDCLLIPACIPTCINMCIAIVHTYIHTNSYSNISNNLPTYSTTDYLFLRTRYLLAYLHAIQCIFFTALSVCFDACLSVYLSVSQPRRQPAFPPVMIIYPWRTPLPSVSGAGDGVHLFCDGAPDA